MRGSITTTVSDLGLKAELGGSNLTATDDTMIRAANKGEGFLGAPPFFS
jgi:hypothetical protein